MSSASIFRVEDEGDLTTKKHSITSQQTTIWQF